MTADIMNHEQLRQLEETTRLVKEIHTEVFGNPLANRPSFFQRVAKLEEWKSKIDAKMARYAGMILGAGIASEGIKWLLEAMHK